MQIRAISHRTGVPKTQVRKALRAYAELLHLTLVNGGRFVIDGQVALEFRFFRGKPEHGLRLAVHRGQHMTAVGLRQLEEYTDAIRAVAAALA